MAVYTSTRTFLSIQELIASDSPELDVGLSTDAMQTYWWYRDRVRFEANTSAGLVEVDGQKVLLGYPAYFKTYEFEDGESALYWAWRKHLEWVEWYAAHTRPDDWREFVSLKHEDSPAIAVRLDVLNAAESLSAPRLTSRKDIAEVTGWDVDGYRVAKIWNLLGQGKGVEVSILIPPHPQGQTHTDLRFTPCPWDWDVSNLPQGVSVVDLRNPNAWN